MKEKEVTAKHVLAIISCALMAFISILTETSLNVTFPTLMKIFKVSLGTIQWTTTGYLLMIAVIIIASSYLNERFSARQLFLTAAITFILGSLICGLANSFPVLLIGRLISSFGAGLSIPLLFNLVVELMPRSRWGFWMGIAGLVIALAPALGPTFGGTVIYYWNWRLIFHIVICIGVIVLILGAFAVEKYHPKKNISFDWGRYVVIALALVVFNLGFNQIENGLTDIWFWLGMIATAFLVWLFIHLSKTSTKKLVNLAVFKCKAFIYALIAYFSLQFINIGISFVLPNYAQIVGGSTSLFGGLILLPGSIISSIFNPIFGRFYDTHGAKAALYTGSIMFIIASVLFMIFGLNLTTIMLMIFYTVLMLGHRMCFNNTMAEAMKVQTNQMRTDATAVFETTQQYAGSMGTAVTAAIISIWQNRAGNYRVLTNQGSEAAFCFIAILSIVILFCYWKMFSLENKPKD